MNQNTSALFIGDLSSCCSIDDIEKEFSKYGEIVDIRIKTDPETKKKLSYGFVEFTSRDAAENAMKSLHGFVLCGRALRISWASSRSNNGSEIRSDAIDKGGLKYLAGTTSASVHVTFVTLQPDVLVTEETLRNMFSEFGNVIDVVVKKTTKINNGCHTGYAFVHYHDAREGLESTMNAVNTLGNVTVNNVAYTCTISRQFASKLMGGSTSNSSSSGGYAPQDMTAGGGMHINSRLAIHQNEFAGNVVIKHNNHSGGPFPAPLVRRHTAPDVLNHQYDQQQTPFYPETGPFVGSAPMSFAVQVPMSNYRGGPHHRDDLPVPPPVYGYAQQQERLPYYSELPRPASFSQPFYPPIMAQHSNIYAAAPSHQQQQQHQQHPLPQQQQYAHTAYYPAPSPHGVAEVSPNTSIYGFPDASNVQQQQNQHFPHVSQSPPSQHQHHSTHGHQPLPYYVPPLHHHHHHHQQQSSAFHPPLVPASHLVPPVHVGPPHHNSNHSNHGNNGGNNSGGGGYMQNSGSGGVAGVADKWNHSSNNSHDTTNYQPIGYDNLYQRRQQQQQHQSMHRN